MGPENLHFKILSGDDDAPCVLSHFEDCLKEFLSTPFTFALHVAFRIEFLHNVGSKAEV